MCLPATNKDVANILVERGRQPPCRNEVNREDEGSEIVWWFPERTSWMRVETNSRRDI